MKSATFLLTALCATGLKAAGTLDIYFVDVEIGNAVPLVTPSGQTMLMDAGSHLVATHYHNHHYGAIPVPGPVDGQSTYDPREITKLVGEETAKVGPILRLVGLQPGQEPDAHFWHLYEEASPITHVTAAAPPVFMYYSRP